MEASALFELFPVANQLTDAQQARLACAAVRRSVGKGAVLHGGGDECLGLVLVAAGQLRAFLVSEDGREITLYRLFERDICLFSASCMLHGLQFDISVEAEKDSEVFIIAPDVYRQLMEQSAPLANYTNAIMASRFSDVMWLIEQVLWKSLDRRLAAFLLEESNLEQTEQLKITHEKIAAHLGTAREVVTRMLRYFQSEGLARLSRGEIELLQPTRLRKLAGE